MAVVKATPMVTASDRSPARSCNAASTALVSPISPKRWCCDDRGTGWPILFFGSALPFEIATMVEQNITPTISTLDEARLFDEEAQRRGKNVGVHVEIDTGMGRVGFWHENAVEQILQIAALHHLRLEALYTHFPSADENLTKRVANLRSF